MEENKPEYLLIDVASSRIPLLKYGEDLYITKMFPNTIHSMEKLEFLPNRWEEQTISDLKDMTLDEKISEYAMALKTLVPEERIILFEVRCVQYYVELESNTIHPFDNKIVDTFNRDIDKVFELIKKYLPQAIVVSFPCNMLGLRGHRWGTYPLHFIYEYYEYGFEAFNLINKSKQNKEVSELQLSLLQLLVSFEKIIQFKYRNYKKVSENETSIIQSKNLWSTCANFFEKLSYDFIKENCLVKIFDENCDKKAVILKSQDKCGKFVKQLCLVHNISVVGEIDQHLYSKMTIGEIDLCKSCDVIIDCNIYGDDRKENVKLHSNIIYMFDIFRT